MQGVVEKVYEQVVDRNRGEAEFHQAVREVLESLEPVITKHPSYAEGALTYLNINNKPCLFILRTLVLVFIVWGAREAITTVFDAADAVMGIMAIINLVGITLLSGLVVKLTRDYFEQAKHGDPRFRLSDYPELKGQIEEEIWK